MMEPACPFKAEGSPYPQEFCEETVRYWLSSGQSLKTVAADLGVSPECLRSWRSQMESSGTQAQITTDSTSGSAPAATAKELTLAREIGEIGELRRELEAMTRQRDIFKRLLPLPINGRPSPKTKVSTEV